MLRVTIEIVPAGIEGLKRTIGVMELGLRDDSELPLKGNYNVRLRGEVGEDTFVVQDHTRTAGALELIRRAIEVACDIGREPMDPVEVPALSGDREAGR